VAVEEDKTGVIDVELDANCAFASSVGSREFVRRHGEISDMCLRCFLRNHNEIEAAHV